jgi:hypothetical protein
MATSQMARSEKQLNHIWPHRAWIFVLGEGEFSLEEHEHILRCVRCLRLFLLCQECNNFGSVLRQLDDSAA